MPCDHRERRVRDGNRRCHLIDAGRLLDVTRISRGDRNVVPTVITDDTWKACAAVSRLRHRPRRRPRRPHRHRRPSSGRALPTLHPRQPRPRVRHGERHRRHRARTRGRLRRRRHPAATIDVRRALVRAGARAVAGHSARATPSACESVCAGQVLKVPDGVSDGVGGATPSYGRAHILSRAHEPWAPESAHPPSCARKNHSVTPSLLYSRTRESE